jgi:cytochrome c oxidase assembly protein subunit 15
MTSVPARQVADGRAVRWWLLTIVVLIAIMALVGAATRLTESGLSIVEWKPVIGALPPLDQEQWNQAFEAYKAIPQYRELNAGMTLGAFKTIFWWEWTHRLLGRVIGIAFLLPFLWFLWRGVISAELRLRLWLIFGLGALQGVIGWWMVASGLSERVEVSHHRLATHLMLALLIFSAIVWTLRRMAGGPPLVASARLKVTSLALLLLTVLQIYLGALLAGLRAGRVYNTWPGIDGAFIPSAARLFFEEPWWRNLFDNTLTVQFEHRMVAYTLFALAMVHAIDAVRSRAGAAANGALWLAAAVTLQAVLGILTLLNQVPIALGLAHQAAAMTVLTLAIFQAERLAVRQPDLARQELAAPVGQPG